MAISETLAEQLVARGRADVRRYLDRPEHRHFQWGTAAIETGASVTDPDASAIYVDALYTELLARAPQHVPAWWRAKHASTGSP
jgi:hypothetical protein